MHSLSQATSHYTNGELFYHVSSEGNKVGISQNHPYDPLVSRWNRYPQIPPGPMDSARFASNYKAYVLSKFVTDHLGLKPWCSVFERIKKATPISNECRLYLFKLYGYKVFLI